MKVIIPLTLILISQICVAQIQVMKLDKSSIPKTIQYSGHIVNAVRWTDSLGDNVVITTETGIVQNKSGADEFYQDAALYAYHYLLQADSFKLTWKVYDFIKSCPVDIKANFIKNTFAVTDLNKDGKYEVWLMYKTVCHGDVSPCDMKIVMYESNKKYAVRGKNRVEYAEKQYTGGEYKFDYSFTTGPESFREYAARLWEKNIMETWD